MHKIAEVLWAGKWCIWQLQSEPWEVLTWVLISIQNSVNLHSELAWWVISILQRDDLQTPGDQDAVAAQSCVIHHLCQTGPKLFLRKVFLPMKSSTFGKKIFAPPTTHYLEVCSKFTFPSNAAQTLTLSHHVVKKANVAHHSFLSPPPVLFEARLSFAGSRHFVFKVRIISKTSLR